MTPNYIEQAIRKAVDGGYDDDFGVGTPRFQEYPKWQIVSGLKMMTLDPSFWKSLGKAMEWKDEMKCPACWQELSNKILATAWMCHWHRFIDHLTAGKDAESYFKEILQ